MCVALSGQGERVSRAGGQTPIGAGSSGAPQVFERENLRVRAATAKTQISLSGLKQNWQRAGRAVQNWGYEFHELLRSS